MRKPEHPDGLMSWILICWSLLKLLCVEVFNPQYLRMWLYLEIFFNLLLFSCRVMSDSAAPWTAAHQASLSITISQSLLKLMSSESVMLSNHLILCHPLLLTSIFPSIRVFFNESALCFRWPNSWNFSFSIHSSSEYSGLISFRIDWFDLLAVQGTLKNLLQHHSSKALIPWSSAFFMV